MAKKTTKRSIVELIAHKRDGKSLSEAEIQSIIKGFTAGKVADYQMTALAMAIYLRSMTPKETAALTLAMRDSGKVVRLRGGKGKRVDKHSTGGVGDKISICLAPMVAACGVRVPMVSGRGLGHTGGTLDKLEAIKGFDVRLSTQGFIDQVADIGCALIGQTDDIAPADRRLYSLRDVTATVESIPLITASILSKKLAEGIDGLVLDVKVGRGAFMKNIDDARELARSLVRVGKLAGKKVVAILTRMDAPLGLTIGNALETAEAFRVLHGEGPEDVTELTYTLGAQMLRLADVAKTDAQARRMLREAVESGRAAEKMRQIIKAQGGDARVVDEPDRLPAAKIRIDVKAEKSGYVQGIDSMALGLAGVAMGAGRTRADQAVDPSVGIVLKRVVGERVKKGETVAELHLATRRGSNSLEEKVAKAYSIAGRAPTPSPLILETVRR